MVRTAKIAAHVRVLEVNPDDGKLSQGERADGQVHAIALEVLASMHGAVQGQRLVMVNPLVKIFGRDLANYPKGSQWVFFLSPALVLGAGGVAEESALVQQFTCAASAARVRDGKLDPTDLNPLMKFARSPNLGVAGQSDYDAAQRAEEQARAAERRKLPVEEYMRKYLDLFKDG